MRFLEYGFIKVGEWKLDGNLKSGIRCILYELQDERVIYAYTINEEIKYVGVCDTTSTALKSRMNRYQSMIGGSTNERVAKLIQKALMEGKEVKIYAWKPESDIQFRGLKIDLVKGLENPLIQQAKPEWNIKS